MSLIVGVDPGETTAMSCCRNDIPIRYHLPVGDIKKPSYVEVARFLTTCWESGNVRNEPVYVAVEDFVGNGMRNPHSVYTMEMLGFIMGFTLWRGMNLVVQAPQRRLGFVELARETLEQYNIKSPVRHLVDATAHALACGYDLANAAKV